DADQAACAGGEVFPGDFGAIDPIADAVRQAYVDCLLRSARDDEVNGWVATGQDAGALRVAICNSPEAARATMVINSYVNCLGRHASTEEVRGWVEGPGDVNGLRDGICNSMEAGRREVAQAYQRCLNRAASPAEIDGWVNLPASIADLV